VQVIVEEAFVKTRLLTLVPPRDPATGQLKSTKAIGVKVSGQEVQGMGGPA
jgi:hypothetical protein